jgi:hypothetical protein
MIQVQVCGWQRQRRQDYNNTSTFFSKKVELIIIIIMCTMQTWIVEKPVRPKHKNALFLSILVSLKYPINDGFVFFYI